MTTRPRILSGVQPSGRLHIGNYFGAIKQHIERQEQGDCFYFIADYHALTTLKEAEDRESGLAAKNKSITPRPARRILSDSVRDAALDYLALGLDPTRVAFFRQSVVPEVCELSWILSSLLSVSALELSHSYKDKVAKGVTPNAALLTYPVLMAADILLYRSHLVPVGKDQKQHLEMARDLAGAFNRQFGDVFPIPEPVFNDAAVVPGTDGQKMSKSYSNTIGIFADGKELQRAVMGIVTDSTATDSITAPPPTILNLYRLFADPTELNSCGGYGDMKKKLLDRITDHFATARERRRELERDPGHVEEVLSAGAKRARAVAGATMRVVRERVGLR